MHRFPADTETTADIAMAAIAAHRDAVDDASECLAIWQSLSHAAAQGAEDSAPDWSMVKALWLVADACSMTLRGDNTNEPFKAFRRFETSRSAVVEDFTPGDVALFSDLAAGVPSRLLRARLSDLAWIGAKSKKIADAYRAIDTYLERPPTEENHRTVLNDWRRAITLCLQIGKAAGDRLRRIKTDLMTIAATALPLDGTLGLAAAQTVFERRLDIGLGRELPDLLAAAGTRRVAAGSYLHARLYLSLACDWYARVKNIERAADMTLAMALSWETEADQRISGDATAGHVVAGVFFENAIQTLRKIPRDQRPSRDVDVHLERLQRRLSDSGQHAIKGMHTIATGPIDITESVRHSEQAVSGKSLLQALIQLAHLHSGADAARLAESAKQSMQEYLFSSMFGSCYYSTDGRVIAKTSAGRGCDPAQQAASVFEAMMRHYLWDVDLICKAQILPAMAIILREHAIRKVDLVHLMSQAPIVPPNRAAQFAKALWEGFEYDFASAAYLLAPQVENLVRWHLKQAGATTTRLDTDGIESEVGLSTLIEAPEFPRVFGANEAFEIQALFCTPFGPNLRNEVAHGLLSDDECHTASTVYAWWWVLHLTLGSLLQAMQGTALSAHSGPYPD